MDYLYAIEIRDGQIVLAMEDLAALLSGRILMAWGELDFRIETLLQFAWGHVANRQEAEGREIDPMPVEGRSTHRLKLLRRYFRAICNEDEGAMTQFDRISGEQRRLESIRSSIAHGLTMGYEKDGDYVVSPWTYTEVAGDQRTRDALISEFTFAEMQAATNDINAVRENLEALVTDYAKPFICKTVAMAAAKSWPPTNSPTPG